MLINANPDVGIDLSRIEELTRKFPQFPIESDIRDMRADTREDLLGALRELRITKIADVIDIPPVIHRQFLSIEEEFDVQARVEQRLIAGLSWLRHAENNLLCGRTKESTEMIIYRFPDQPQSSLSLRAATTG